MKKPLPPGWVFAALALSLGFLWAVLSFLVFAEPRVKGDAPASAQAAPQNNAKAKESKRPNNQGTPSPLGKNLGSPESQAEWRPVASLDSTERNAEIAELEARVVRENAIHRLNVGEVSDADRKEYGRVFARIVELKSIALKEDIGDLTAKAYALEASHARRLAAAGLTGKTQSRSH